jgi:hypothetical protein
MPPSLSPNYVRQKCIARCMTGCKSYTELGLQYELHIQSLLSNHCFDLRHSGGRADGGVDLRGNWNLPGINSLPALVQCKNITGKCPPTVVRELEGVVASRLQGTIAVLTCTQPSSELARQRIQASPWPLLFLFIKMNETAIYEAVQSDGLRKMLPGFVVSSSFSRDYSSGRLEERLLFTFQGRPLS